MWTGNATRKELALFQKAVPYFEKREAAFRKLTNSLEAHLRFAFFDPTTNKPVKGLQINTIESRTKSKVSYWNKVLRKANEYNRSKRKFDFKKNIDDCIGVRIIHYKKSERDHIIGIIKKSGLTDTLFQKKTSESDRFGYQAIHLTVKLPAQWKKKVGISLRDNFFAEIQIVTLSQHIWANLSHKVNYKFKRLNQVDERALFKMSALCELIDDIYDDLSNREGENDGNK